ncbi:MAG: M90 family metallopeptidase [Desulfurivibrio sp.]|nr:M90 family metallopeptidase [Desulfurivibrio sp.]
MWQWFHEWRRRRLLRRAALSDELWGQAVARPRQLFAGLAPDEQRRLRELATRLLAQKRFYGGGGLVVTPFMRASIAAQACVPILNLGLGCYAGWTSIVVYRESFMVPREEIDEVGIVHSGNEVLAGESWPAGPVVLSWAECAPGADYPGPAGNVVIHEFAHKLDMLSGAVNGTPPLPGKLSAAAWAAAMETAWQSLQEAAERGESLPVDVYATHDPGEFFAVLSEHFFMAPAELCRAFPEAYRQLALYYRRDPLVAGWC